MKFKCVEDTENTGVFTTKIEKVHGLTKGKTYTGSINVHGHGYEIIRVVVFNDNRKWAWYPPRFFEPGQDLPLKAGGSVGER